MDCVWGFASQGQHASLIHHSEGLPEQGAFLVRQSDKFIGESFCSHVISALNAGEWYVERIHQGGGLADRARILEGAVCICKRGLGIAKHPENQRPKRQCSHLNVLAKSRRQRTMPGRIVKRERPIKVTSSFSKLSR